MHVRDDNKWIIKLVGSLIDTVLDPTSLEYNWKMRISLIGKEIIFYNRSTTYRLKCSARSSQHAESEDLSLHKVFDFNLILNGRSMLESFVSYVIRKCFVLLNNWQCLDTKTKNSIEIFRLRNTAPNNNRELTKVHIKLQLMKMTTPIHDFIILSLSFYFNNESDVRY